MVPFFRVSPGSDGPLFLELVTDSVASPSPPPPELACDADSNCEVACMVGVPPNSGARPHYQYES